MEAVLRRSANDLVPLYKKNTVQRRRLEIDFESHTVRKNRHEGNLTPNEFRILAALINIQTRSFRGKTIYLSLSETNIAAMTGLSTAMSRIYARR
jgi:DNA-binding response OmpR family regulator